MTTSGVSADVKARIEDNDFDIPEYVTFKDSADLDADLKYAVQFAGVPEVLAGNIFFNRQLQAVTNNNLVTELDEAVDATAGETIFNIGANDTLLGVELNDLLTSARANGYFNISDIDYALMETTGNISFQPVPLKRQLTPKDFNFAPEREEININVIMDGRLMSENLKKAGMTEKELEKKLKEKNRRREDVLLATVDGKKQLTIFDK